VLSLIANILSYPGKKTAATKAAQDIGAR